MKKRKNLLVFLFVLTAAFDIHAQSKNRIHYTLCKPVNTLLKEALSQYQVLSAGLAKDSFPRSYDPTTRRLVTSDKRWWCSGFYPGTLFYLQRFKKDQKLAEEAKRKLDVLASEQFDTTTHDLGFMMYCSFGNAYKNDPLPEYKNILINSARSLATRFDAKVGCIRSWNSKDPSDFTVIIDNMMNLELLFWATKATGDSSFYRIAVAHANTTLRNHFRRNYSSYHVVIYDAQTGQVKRRKTAQGANDESSWARGQAWGLYGYTVMYRETGDLNYLTQAQHIAAYILAQSGLPKDKIPFWDYNAPRSPLTSRDASAAAITASALLELSDYVGIPESRYYKTNAMTILRSLSSPAYRARAGTNGGFILRHSVGHKPMNSEIDVPLSYADYYYIEALFRYKRSLLPASALLTYKLNKMP